MKLAAYGMVSDGAGSGAGAFPLLLRALLERGHGIDFYGTPGYTEPRSLERFPQYRFLPLRLDTLRRTRRALKKVPSAYASALEAQVDHFLFHREAVRRIEEEHVGAGYDLVLCTDAQALARCALPVVCWPQSPPDSEAAALRAPGLARVALENQGLARYLAVQVFYAYRWLLARAALDISDLYLCGSTWAKDSWQRFGADPARLRTLAYPIELEPFDSVPPLAAGADGTVTFLWLGRAVPRKRLDLFLRGFEILHRRQPLARARLVGRLDADPFARRLLDAYRNHPALRVEGARPRASVPELLAEVDVIVQPSQSENFGFSIAEALAAGRPVVVGPTNGTGEYAGPAGYWFSDYTPESVAGAMERAFTAVRSEGPAVSARAREAAREHFAIDRVVDRFSAFCTELLARRGRPV